MAEILDLFATDSSNIDRYPEGQAPSTLNNGGRALEGILARWAKDTTDTTLTSSGSANVQTLTPNRTIAAYYDGLTFTFQAGFTNTGTVTMNVSALGVKTIKRGDGNPALSGDMVAGGIYTIVYENTSGFFFLLNPSNAVMQRGGIDGLITSNGTDTDHDIDIAVGKCRNAANDGDIEATSVITLAIDAAAGAGSIDTGSVAADTWYHVHIISDNDGVNATSGVFSLSVSSPTMPSGYDERQLIWSVLTDVSSNIIAFYQNQDFLGWESPPLDINTTTLSTTQVLETLSTPLGIKVEARLRLTARHASASRNVLVNSPDETDSAPSVNAAPGVTVRAGSSGDRGNTNVDLWTNTSSQVGTRSDAANTELNGWTVGFRHPRGRNG